MKKERAERIKKAVLKKPYIFYFIGIFLAYLIINLVVNQLYVGFEILTSLALWFRIPFLLFNFLLIPSLVALTINLSILRFSEAGFALGGGGITSAGIFGGFLGGACPSCFVGLFPAFLGIFGVTASLSVLPLYGLEILALSAVLLVIAIMLLTRDIYCEVPYKNQKQKL